MRRYRAPEFGLEEMSRFFQSVDDNLVHPISLVVIGGAAAAFHRVESTTEDVDTWEIITGELEQAIEAARNETGLKIPVVHSGAADAPWEFESRLVRVLPHLEKLEIKILERHDLALSKCVRGEENDYQQLGELHDRNALDFDVLVTRFQTEMSHVMGDRSRILEQFLELVHRLFGELRRSEADRRLGKDGRA